MKVPLEKRTKYDGKYDKQKFISEWHERGYPRPLSNWDATQNQLHHIKPLERGGTNDFWNIVPLHPDIHKQFTEYWRSY